MAESVEETLKTLKLLQSVDDQLGEKRASVAALSLRVDAHKKRVTALESELAEKTAQLHTDEKDSGMKELALKSIQEKIAKLKTQLNVLKDNKQYTAMMHEISSQEAAGSHTEDQALILMDKIEDTRAAIEEVKRQIEETRGQVRDEEAAVADEVEELSGQIHQLMAERQGLVAQLDPAVVERYRKIAHGRGGKALVAVINGVCQGCYMGVTRQTISRLWAKKELMYCPNCSRLMYLEGEVQ